MVRYDFKSRRTEIVFLSLSLQWESLVNQASYQGIISVKIKLVSVSPVKKEKRCLTFLFMDGGQYERGTHGRYIGQFLISRINSWELKIWSINDANGWRVGWREFLEWVMCKLADVEERKRETRITCISLKCSLIGVSFQTVYVLVKILV